MRGQGDEGTEVHDMKLTKNKKFKRTEKDKTKKENIGRQGYPNKWF